MSQNLVEIKHLTTVFTDKNPPEPVLRDVSLQIPEHAVVGLVGQSGSGKSVTAMSVLQLLYNKQHQTTGSILYRGEDLLTYSRRQIEQIRGNEIAMVFQDPMTSLNPVYPVGKQVGEVLRGRDKRSAKERKEQILRMFAEMGIHQPERCYHSYPHELSGGLRQRVMIAMAMLTKPKLVIADEPTTALDVTVQAQILDQMRMLRDTYGTSILLITHNLGIVSRYCDLVYVMYQGRIVEQGTTAQVVGHPAHDYTKKLLAARFSVPEAAFTGKSEPVPTQKPRPETERRPILVVRDLNKQFANASPFALYNAKSLHANKNLSLTVYEGETLAIVGESGSGKSTFGRQIAGLLKPDSGQILYNGTDLVSLPGKEKKALHREIQMVFQDPYASLDPRMDVFHTIEEPLLVHRICPDRQSRDSLVRHMMDQVGLSQELANRLPRELSGGQRQRVGIARALIMRPRVIVWDEPVSALDVLMERQIINLIRELKNTYGFTSIFITHDMAVVYHIADRICVMKRGEIVEIGERDALFRNPQTDYTKQLLSSIL